MRHRIALCLGMTLSELDEMPAEEFASWCAYFEIEPWGTHALEILIAQLSQITWGASGAKNPPRMEQLMPFSQHRQAYASKHMTAEQLYQKAVRQAKSIGVKVDSSNG